MTRSRPGKPVWRRATNSPGYAIGYTLLDLDRPREAHEQLRHYSALVRHNA
jgi:hypothetical protein